jgi:hypothetical protein
MVSLVNSRVLAGVWWLIMVILLIPHYYCMSNTGRSRRRLCTKVRVIDGDRALERDGRPELRGATDKIGDIAISPDPSKQNRNQAAASARR